MRGHDGHACSGEVQFGDGESVLVEHVLGERAVSAANLGRGVKDECGQNDRDPGDYRGQGRMQTVEVVAAVVEQLDRPVVDRA
ncbi:hypothetical protein SIM91_03585 [Rhodococcus opacus]|uniref:hypothetical protein n=1 Tax=Rhodococcus opacus TaxID=37919 RepID=UPI0012DAEF42|nr:hypothetical protein [Rhodococcus opacus]MDX5962423.1 hypothetical protein [Rhodococcus opacus]